MFDVCVVGAGPCGISCAITAQKSGLSVALVEGGNQYDNRKCLADYSEECAECSSCNVIAGFGGCVHYGDSAKLSFYPSGKELYEKISRDYCRILEEACKLWNVEINEFSKHDFPKNSEDFEIKAFPVRVMTSAEIKSVIETLWEEVCDLEVTLFQADMIDFCENEKGVDVILNNGEHIQCKYIVLAMGRRGIKWLHENAEKKEMKISKPRSSMGFRFEMPREYLISLGKLHPDFKFRMKYKGYKYKTFCFCAGDHGGRLKFANYGDYTLLDGHVMTEADNDCKYGNFALLRQIIREDDKMIEKVNEIKNKVLSDYSVLFHGKPICQKYTDFRKGCVSQEETRASAKCVKQGEVYKLLDSDLEDYCYVAEKVFGEIAKYAKCSVNEIVDSTIVIGLELEGLWDKIETDNNFRIKNRAVFVGGDCGGETQGILQASISGIRIAEALVQSTKQ